MALNARLYGDPSNGCTPAPGWATCPRARGRGDLPRPAAVGVPVAAATAARPACRGAGPAAAARADAGGRRGGRGPAGPRRTARRSNGGAGTFALWIMLLWVPLTLLGGVLDPAHPKLRLQLLRYWYPVFPAFVLGGVAALWLGARAVRRPVRLRVDRAAAAVPCRGRPPGAVAVAGPPRPRRAGPARTACARTRCRSSARWLARSGAAYGLDRHASCSGSCRSTWCSPTGHRIWHGRLRPLVTADAAPAPGDYVVAYSVGSDACPRCGDTAQAVLPPVPADLAPGHDEPRPPSARLAGRVKGTAIDGHRFEVPREP